MYVAIMRNKIAFLEWQAVGISLDLFFRLQRSKKIRLKKKAHKHGQCMENNLTERPDEGKPLNCKELSETAVFSQMGEK